ncbi:uncharacterized protein METZ01_LOCUS184389 [marine metagenome]|uniref:Uncharacterized protein n=1 Tax=marine metagenome TaxID=408172 RepID=A0A382CZN4_9ZZZZ|tara:strand:+ start:188 stop:292 length:105 start_codon:yes stop_codon:yes gene_type:complete
MKISYEEDYNLDEVYELGNYYLPKYEIIEFLMNV